MGPTGAQGTAIGSIRKEAAGFNSAQRSTDAGNRKIGSQGSRIGSINQELRLNCRREHSCSAIELNCWPDRSSEKIGQAIDEGTDNRQPLDSTTGWRLSTGMSSWYAACPSFPSPLPSGFALGWGFQGVPYCPANGFPIRPPQHGSKGSRRGNREPVRGAKGALSWGNRRGNRAAPAGQEGNPYKLTQV